MEKLTSILIERGTYTLGRTQLAADGSVVSHREPKWTPSRSGCSVVVCPISSQDRTQVDQASIFPAWSGISMAEDMMRKLGLEINTPNFVSIWRNAARDGIDICDYCEQQGQRCENCCVKMGLMEET